RRLGVEAVLRREVEHAARLELRRIAFAVEESAGQRTAADEPAVVFAARRHVGIAHAAWRYTGAEVEVAPGLEPVAAAVVGDFVALIGFEAEHEVTALADFGTGTERQFVVLRIAQFAGA